MLLFPLARCNCIWCRPAQTPVCHLPNPQASSIIASSCVIFPLFFWAPWLIPCLVLSVAPRSVLPQGIFCEACLSALGIYVVFLQDLRTVAIKSNPATPSPVPDSSPFSSKLFCFLRVSEVTYELPFSKQAIMSNFKSGHHHCAVQNIWKLHWKKTLGSPAEGWVCGALQHVWITALYTSALLNQFHN